ncbi:MAG: VCBS repeat-containing protein [Planctomycetes bacterium]|nr:VCBS repeat-containing protein [Planctomycetota bacterium]
MKLRLPAVAATAAILSVAAVAQTAPPGRLVEQRLRMPPGLGPAGLSALLDLNGDGLLDLARTSGMWLTILLQDANGRFEQHQPAIDFSFSGGITALAAGSLGTNNAHSLVVGMAGADEVVLSSDGVSAFAVDSPSPIPPLGVQRVTPVAIMVGDFGGGAGDDVVIMASNGNSRVLLDDGAGNLVAQPVTVLPLAARGAQSAAVAHDLDADGDLDIVCSPQSGPTTLVLRNDSGTFTTVAAVPNVSARSIIVGQFSGSSALDVIVFQGPTAPTSPWLIESAVSVANVPVVLPWAGQVLGAGAGDFDGNGVDEVVLMELDGSVSIGWNVTLPLVPVLAADQRSRLLIGDLESDGDPDIVALGQVPPDDILLGDGVGGLLATEVLSVDTAEIAGDHFGVFVGAQPSRDPNLLIMSSGQSMRYLRNTDGTRFGPQPNPLPALGAIDPAVAEPAAFAANGAGVVLVDPAVPAGVRLLEMQPTGALVDMTTTYWPSTGWFVDVVAGRFGAAPQLGPSDLVLATLGGTLELYRQVGGIYSLVSGAMPTQSFAGITDLLAGDFDGDDFTDVCVLHAGGASVIRGGDDSVTAVDVFQTQVITQPIGGGVSFGEAAELNGDGKLDLILATPGLAFPLSLWEGIGDGSFAHASFVGMPLVVDGVIDIAVLGEGERQVVAIALPGGQLSVMPRAPIGDPLWFETPVRLPLHGEGLLVDLIAVDVEGDGDDDLAVLRDGAVPQILPNRDTQLSVMNVGQMGRAIDFDFYGEPNDLMVMFFDFGPTLRFYFPPFGTLRLGAPLTLIQLPIGVTAHERFRWNVPAGFLPNGLVMNLQLAWLRGAEIKLGNAHALPFVDN